MWASVEEARSSCMVSYRKIVEQFAASPASLPLLLVWTSLKNGHRKSVPTDYLFTTELKLDTSGGILFSDDQIKIEAVEVLTDRFQTRSKGALPFCTSTCAY